MSNKNADHYFLRGGGEMGELIRAKDWSETSLGDPADWPQSLQTMVAVMLDNPFGMYIAWGSKYIQLYNDGYRPILGANKHPQALGISTRETFSEIWDNIIGSMFDDVMKGKAVGFPDLMLPLNRNGFIEECYFDFSYSPIRKNDGEVGGVLVTVIETTEKKKAQAALIENTTQLKFAMDAAELGTWDYNPATDKFTANNRLKTWFGIAASEEIALHRATDAIAEKDRDRIIMAIKKALDFSSGGIYDEEFSIINPITNVEVIVHVKGRAWFNDEKIAYRFNGILQEVTQNVLARKKIEDSEQQLRIAIEGGEFGTFDFLPQTNQLIWSNKTNELFGLPPGAATSYETYISAIHPEDRDTSKAIAQQQARLKEGGLYELEYRTIGITDGKLRWLRSKGKATYNNKGEPIRYTGVIQEITKQKEAAEILRQSDRRFRDTVRQAPVGICILRGTQYIVEMANDAYLQLVDKKEVEFIGNPLFETLPEVEEAVHALLDNVLNTGIPYHGNELPVFINRYGKQDVCYFDFLYHPLKEEDEKISGVIAIVTEVTEKVEARKTIEERKRLYESITQNIPDLIYVFDLKYRFTYANEALLNMWGRSWVDSVGKSMLEVGYESWHAEMHEGEIDEVIATKKPVRGEVSFPHATLGKRMYDYILVPVIDDDGKVEAIAGTTRDITQQVEARRQIEESEQRFQAAVKAVQGILWTNNAKGEMEGEQPGWALLTGQTYEEYRGYGWAKAIHPDDVQPTLDSWNKAVQERKTFVFEHRLKTKDGQWRDFSVRAIPLLNADGTLLQWVGVHTDITDSKQAAIALKANEEKLTIVIEASELGTWEVDVKTNIVEGSRRLHEIMGYPQKNGLTLTDTLDRIHPDYVQLRAEAFKKAYETGIFYFTGQIIWDDKSIHWIESKGKVFYDEQKNPVTIIGTTADITEEKQHQQEMEESEERFRNVANSAPVLIWMADTDKRCYFFNKGWLNFTGRTVEQESGNGWVEGVHPDDLQKCLDIYVSSFDKREPFYMEYRLKRHDGAYRWLSDSGVPRFTPDGEFEGYIGACMDINNEKVHQQELEEREEKFRLLADFMPQHIWTADPEGNLNYFNRSVFDYSGLTLEQINKDGWIQIVHPDDREENIKQWFNAVSTGESFLFEHRFRRYDGAYRWQLSRAVPQKDKNGTIQMWVGTSTDIQEQKTREEKKDEFIGIASHEMKTPLTTAKAYLEMLELVMDQNNQEATTYAKKASQSVNRLNQLISELLDVTKIRFGKLNYTITTFNFNELIDSTVENMQLISTTHAIIKTGKVDDEITGDKERLQQVVINLLTNAIKYSPRAQNVFISIEQEAGNIKVSVKDTGIGIAKQSLCKIFEKYHRVDEHAVHFQGLGIGLFICYEIIERHHGKLWAESEPGKGSIFYFTIPVNNMSSK